MQTQMISKEEKKGKIGRKLPSTDEEIIESIERSFQDILHGRIKKV